MIRYIKQKITDLFSDWKVATFWCPVLMFWIGYDFHKALVHEKYHIAIPIVVVFFLLLGSGRAAVRWLIEEAESDSYLNGYRRGSRGGRQ